MLELCARIGSIPEWHFPGARHPLTGAGYPLGSISGNRGVAWEKEVENKMKKVDNAENPIIINRKK